jgi:hypothetical protein
MSAFVRFASFIGCVVWIGFIADAVGVRAASNCPDSTESFESLVPILGWDIPADGWDIAVGTNGFVYVADPVNDRVCRYSLYGGGEMCWTGPGSNATEPGYFAQTRWLAWNPVTSRLYVSGQLGFTVPVFDGSGNYLFELKGDSLSTEPGHFAGKTGAVAIDPLTGNAWVHERNTLDGVTVDRIQEFDPNGVFTGRVFNRGPDCRLGSLSGILDLAVDSTGSVYMLDLNLSPQASAVHRVVPGVGCVTTWGNAGGPGGLDYGLSVAIDKDGYINVLDYFPSIVKKYNRDGNLISSVQIGTPSGFSSGLDFMHDAADPFMYVTRFQPHRVEVYGTGVEPRNILETSWVDPSTFQLKTNDLALLAECEDGAQDKRIKMKGVAADGVSPLLLRLHLPESGTVRWELTDPDNPGITEELGALATLDRSDTGVTVDAAVELVDDEYIAFAVYTAPIDFERPSVPADASVGERPLRVTAEFMPDSGPDSVAIVSDLTIERPTVLFLHGYLEESADWNEFKSIVTAVDATRWGDEMFYWGEAVPTPVPQRPVGPSNALVQNYPNPFNPTTTIRFSLARNSHVVLTIYDVRGARVRTLLDEARVSGDHRVVWDGRSDAGMRVSSGIYFYRLTAGGFRETKKMVLLK